MTRDAQNWNPFEALHASPFEQAPQPGSARMFENVLTLAPEANGPASVEWGEVLKVWVLYENAGLCHQACEILFRVATHRQGAAQIVCATSSSNQITDPLRAQALAREARVADLIVVAAQEGPRLPFAFNNWISLWHVIMPGRPTELELMRDTSAGQHGGGRDGTFRLAEVARISNVAFYAAGAGQPLATNEQELTHALTRLRGTGPSGALNGKSHALHSHPLPAVNDSEASRCLTGQH